MEGHIDKAAIAERAFAAINSHEPLTSELRKLLEDPEVKERVITMMAERAAGNLLPHYKAPGKPSEPEKPSEPGKPFVPTTCGAVFESLKDGDSVVFKGTTTELQDMLRLYKEVFFSMEDDLESSIQVAKILMGIIATQIGFTPIDHEINVRLRYANPNKEAEISILVEFSKDKWWRSLGRALVSSEHHIRMCEEMGGSRFACIIMVILVRGQPHLAILYLGSFYAIFSGDKMYNSYCYPMQVGTPVLLDFKPAGKGKANDVLQLTLTPTVI